MATKTLGLTGRDYSTLAAWATYVNALSLAANEILEVYNDGGPVSDTTSITIGGWTANGFSVTMRPASGQGFKDNANRLTNALRWNASNGAALTNSFSGDIAYKATGANLTIQDLQFKASNSGSSGCMQGRTSAVINRCIIWTAGNYVMPQTHACTINDSLLVHDNGGGIQVSGDSLVVSNCTIASIGGAGTGIQQSYTQSIPPLVKNTVLFNHTTDVQGTCASGTTNNATSKSAISGTGWGTNVQVNVSSADFTNVTAGSEDFRTASGSTKLIGTGASGVGSGSDVVNTTRSGTYGIGAWQAAPPSGFAAGPTAEDATVGGTFQSSNSAMGAGPKADDASVGGSFSRVPGAFSFGPIQRNITTNVTSVPLTWITFLASATGAAVLTRTDVSINGSGLIAGSDVALVPGQAYQATWRESGGQYGSYQFTAA